MCPSSPSSHTLTNIWQWLLIHETCTAMHKASPQDLFQIQVHYSDITIVFKEEGVAWSHEAPCLWGGGGGGGGLYADMPTGNSCPKASAADGEYQTLLFLVSRHGQASSAHWFVVVPSKVHTLKVAQEGGLGYVAKQYSRCMAMHDDLKVSRSISLSIWTVHSSHARG